MWGQIVFSEKCDSSLLHLPEKRALSSPFLVSFKWATGHLACVSRTYLSCVLFGFCFITRSVYFSSSSLLQHSGQKGREAEQKDSSCIHLTLDFKSSEGLEILEFRNTSQGQATKGDWNSHTFTWGLSLSLLLLDNNVMNEKKQKEDETVGLDI